MTLSGASIPGQSGARSDGNEEVLCIPQSLSITGTSQPDFLVSYLGHSLSGVLPLCRESVDGFFCPSRLGTVERNILKKINDSLIIPFFLREYNISGYTFWKHVVYMQVKLSNVLDWWKVYDTKFWTMFGKLKVPLYFTPLFIDSMWIPFKDSFECLVYFDENRRWT